MIPDSDQVKSTVAGNEFISVGDLKEGFNQCDNEPETAEKMAVLVASGSYLPKGHMFGPTNGPEDFQELVFIVFSRRLYKEWFLFLDDLSVATGRPAPHPPGPSGAHDIVTRLTEKTRSERAAAGLGRSASSDPSPYAHWRGVGSIFRFILVCWLVLFCALCPIVHDYDLESLDVSREVGGTGENCEKLVSWHVVSDVRRSLASDLEVNGENRGSGFSQSGPPLATRRRKCGADRGLAWSAAEFQMHHLDELSRCELCCVVRELRCSGFGVPASPGGKGLGFLFFEGHNAAILLLGISGKNGPSGHSERSVPGVNIGIFWCSSLSYTLDFCIDIRTSVFAEMVRRMTPDGYTVCDIWVKGNPCIYGANCKYVHRLGVAGAAEVPRTGWRPVDVGEGVPGYWDCDRGDIPKVCGVWYCHKQDPTKPQCAYYKCSRGCKNFTLWGDVLAGGVVDRMDGYPTALGAWMNSHQTLVRDLGDRLVTSVPEPGRFVDGVQPLLCMLHVSGCRYGGANFNGQGKRNEYPGYNSGRHPVRRDVFLYVGDGGEFDLGDPAKGDRKGIQTVTDPVFNVEYRDADGTIRREPFQYSRVHTGMNGGIMWEFAYNAFYAMRLAGQNFPNRNFFPYIPADFCDYFPPGAVLAQLLRAAVHLAYQMVHRARHRGLAPNRATGNSA